VVGDGRSNGRHNHGGHQPFVSGERSKHLDDLNFLVGTGVSARPLNRNHAVPVCDRLQGLWRLGLRGMEEVDCAILLCIPARDKLPILAGDKWCVVYTYGGGLAVVMPCAPHRVTYPT